MVAPEIPAAQHKRNIPKLVFAISFSTEQLLIVHQIIYWIYRNSLNLVILVKMKQLSVQ